MMSKFGKGSLLLQAKKIARHYWRNYKVPMTPEQKANHLADALTKERKSDIQEYHRKYHTSPRKGRTNVRIA